MRYRDRQKRWRDGSGKYASAPESSYYDRAGRLRDASGAYAKAPSLESAARKLAGLIASESGKRWRGSARQRARVATADEIELGYVADKKLSGMRLWARVVDKRSWASIENIADALAQFATSVHARALDRASKMLLTVGFDSRDGRPYGSFTMATSSEGLRVLNTNAQSLLADWASAYAGQGWRFHSVSLDLL